MYRTEIELTVTSFSLFQVDDPSPVGNGPGPIDSWEDKADMSSTATTPDDDDNSMEDDSGEENMT